MQQNIFFWNERTKTECFYQSCSTRTYDMEEPYYDFRNYSLYFMYIAILSHIGNNNDIILNPVRDPDVCLNI